MIDPNNKIIYVSGDNSGDFNVTNATKYKAHNVINDAIKYLKKNTTYTTIYLKGPFTYWVDGIINSCSNFELTGDTTAAIKLVNRAGWDPYVPLIGPNGVSFKNIKIHGFEIDGNHDGNFDSSKGKAQIFPNINKGLGYYNFIHYDNSSNIEVYDMYMHDGHGDGLRAQNCDTVLFHDNIVKKLGHDPFFCLRSNNCHGYNNKIDTRTNSGTRMNDCTNSSIHDNVIKAWADYWDAGGAGLQIERQYKAAISVEVYNNIIHNTYGPGIWAVKNSAAIPESGKSKVYIHHNTFYECGINPSIYWVGGIVHYALHNVILENNVFDSCYNAGVVSMGMTDKALSNVSAAIYLKNNIIIGTRKRKYSPNGTGYGIHNRLSGNHKMYVDNNCVYNNISGDYRNVTATNDINVNPVCYDIANHDYHLKSTTGRYTVDGWVKDAVHSPCIDAGYPDSSYTSEPPPNGGRINIGLYGNTIYASKSITAESSSPNDTTTLPIEPIKAKDVVTKTETIYPLYNNRLKESDPDLIFKTHTYMDIGAIGGSQFRGLEYFDLSTYDDTKIESAFLYLYWYHPVNAKRTNDTIVEVYRPAQYAAEYATWNNNAKGQKWEHAGGDWYDKKETGQGNVPFASFTLGKNVVPTNKYYKLDVTELVQKYVDDTYYNTGFFIKAQTENNNYVAFYSGKMMATNKKMKLVVTYTG